MTLHHWYGASPIYMIEFTVTRRKTDELKMQSCSKIFNSLTLWFASESLCFQDQHLFVNYKDQFFFTYTISTNSYTSNDKYDNYGQKGKITYQVQPSDPPSAQTKPCKVFHLWMNKVSTYQADDRNRTNIQERKANLLSFHLIPS